MKNDKVYVGIDLASSTMGLVLLNGRQDLLHASKMATVGAKMPDKWERYMTMVGHVVEVLAPYSEKIDKLFIEAYGGAFKSSLIPAVECGTLVRQSLFHMGLRDRLTEIPPTSLKAFTTGKGTSKKEHMLAEVFRKYGWMAPDADQADAYALAVMALKSAVPEKDRAEKLFAYEAKALGSLKL